MNREGIKKHWRVFEAWLAGVEIQFKSRSSPYPWNTTSAPEFNPDNEYRVKPQRKTVTRWVNVHPNGPGAILHDNKDQADHWTGIRRIATVPVEISWEEGEGLE